MISLFNTTYTYMKLRPIYFGETTLWSCSFYHLKSKHFMDRPPSSFEIQDMFMWQMIYGYEPGDVNCSPALWCGYAEGCRVELCVCRCWLRLRCSRPLQHSFRCVLPRYHRVQCALTQQSSELQDTRMLTEFLERVELEESQELSGSQYSLGQVRSISQEILTSC